MVDTSTTISVEDMPINIKQIKIVLPASEYTYENKKDVATTNDIEIRLNWWKEKYFIMKRQHSEPRIYPMALAMNIIE